MMATVLILKYCHRGGRCVHFPGTTPQSGPIADARGIYGFLWGSATLYTAKRATPPWRGAPVPGNPQNHNDFDWLVVEADGADVTELGFGECRVTRGDVIFYGDFEAACDVIRAYRQAHGLEPVEFVRW
jgi:hypothetical protein